MKNVGLFLILGVVILALSGWAAYSLFINKEAPKSNEQKPTVVYVKARNAVIADVEGDMEYRGRLASYDVISLATEVSGRIMKGDVRFKTGEHFNRNDVLLRIYSSDFEASLKSSKSSFLQALSNILPDLNIDFPDEYQKWKSYFSLIDVDKKMPVLPEISTDKEKVFLASKNILSSYYSIEQQEILLSKYVITAPFSGSFKSVSKEIGAVANPGAEIANLIRSDRLEVSVAVFPEDLNWIEEGSDVTVIDRNGKEVVARVNRISEYVDEATQSVNVYLVMINSKENSFLIGEYVDVVFNSVSTSGFEIPREALVDGNSVYVLEDSMLRKKSISIVRQLSDTYIIEGVSENEIVVVESLSSIKPNVQYKARD